MNQESIYIFILGFTRNINSFLNVLLLEKIVHIICLGQKFDSFSNHIVPAQRENLDFQSAKQNSSNRLHLTRNSSMYITVALCSLLNQALDGHRIEVNRYLCIVMRPTSAQFIAMTINKYNCT